MMTIGLAQVPLSAQFLAQSPCELPRSSVTVDVALEPIAQGFELPVHITHAGDGSDRLFVVEKLGLVRVIAKGSVLRRPFLDLGDLIETEVEQGLLGLTFHPDYETNGRLFVFYSEKGTGDSVIAEYRVDPNDPNRALLEEKHILVVPQPETAVHRAGQLTFGPDGYLYIALGNGGPPQNSQKPDELLGALLRLDVDNGNPYTVPTDNPFVDDPHVRPEIWAYGFRNPWRFSIDPCTDRAFVGDVGDAVAEEIDLVVPGGNYGFDWFEGNVCYLYPLEKRPEMVARKKRACATSSAFEQPIHTYRHLGEDSSGGNSVTGGYVYRGRAFPELVGRYIFGDLVSGRIWTLSEKADAQAPGWQVHEALKSDRAFVAFGEDEAGELYVVHFGDRRKGAVYRVVAKGADR